MIGRLTSLLILAVLLGWGTSTASAGDFVPISSGQTGPAFTKAINERLHGQSPIDPKLVCYKYIHLPENATAGKIIRCHGCARTTPCSAGTEHLLAIGTPDGWSCNSGSQFDRLGGTDPTSYQIPIGDLTTIKTSALSFPDRRTVRVDAALTVQASDTCTIGLYLNGSGTPARTAAVAPPQGSQITTQVVLTYETAAPVTGGFSAILRGSSAGTCTILNATDLGGAATVLAINADRN